MPPVTLQLKRLREEAGLTIRGLAEELDLVSSTYAAYEDPNKFKKRLLPMELAKKIASKLEPHGIDAARVLALAGVERGGGVQEGPDDLADRLDAVMLNEVEVSFSMGGGAVIEDWPVVQQVPFSRAWLRGFTTSSPRDLVVARGDGDSMVPTILDQDIVIIDLAQKTPRQQDRIWAMSYGGLGMIKRLRQLPDGTLQINSDNKEVTPISAADGEVTIVGRVVAVVRKI